MKKPAVIKKSSSIPTALVSGGAGFIGSYLCEYLLAKNARVVAVDSLVSGKEENLRNIINNPNFVLYQADINNGLPVDIESVDYIFHLAGFEEYLFGREFVSLDSLLTNSVGTKNLLDLAKKSDAKFVLASTIDVYEGRMSQVSLSKYFGVTKQDENKYSQNEAKRFAESLVWEYFNKYQTDARIIRLPEVFGPGMNMDSSGELGSFLKAVIENRDIIVEKEEGTKKYYLYVSDVVTGIVKALFNNKTKGNIYSLVPDQQVSVLELAYLVKSMADRPLEVIIKSSPSYALPPVHVPDTVNLSDLSWAPKIGLKDGLKATLQWFGYSANTNSFKPAKMLEEKTGQSVGQTSLFSLSDIGKNVPMPQTSQSTQQAQQNQQVISDVGPIVQPEPNTGYRFVNVVDVEEKPSWFEKFKSKFFKSPKPLLPVAATEAIKKPFSKINWQITGTVFAVVFAFVLIFVAYPASNLYFSLRRVEKAFTSLTVSSDDLLNQLSSASKDLELARESLAKLKWLFNVSGKGNTYYSFYKMLGSLTYFARSGEYLAESVKPLEDMWVAIRPGSEQKINPETFSTARLSIVGARNNIKLAMLDYEYVNIENFPEKYREKVELYGNILVNIDQGLELGSKVVSELPNVLGVGGSKKYVLWFQNSNEIRPTGGFIGSYAVLSFVDGKLQEFTIDDIYNPDGQIDVRNIFVAPPTQITQYLGENKLYLRNSNWDPDFTKSARSFDNLYFKVTGDKIDGYAAIDLTFAKSLLKVTGPVFLAAYNEEISENNLYEKAQFYSDFNYQEGVSQKRSFLTVLGGKLIERIFTLPKAKFTVLAGEMNDSLNARHFMLSLVNSPLSNVLNEKKWDGSLVFPDGDYLSIINSNLGGTKANYFVKNTYDYQVSSLTRDGLLRGDLTLTYNHTGESDAWPGGPYKNYVRVYVAKGSKLTGAMFKGPTSGDFEDVMSKVLVTEDGKYLVFGFGVEVGPKQTATLKLNYDLPPTQTFTAENKTYRLYWQKQAGTHDDIFSYAFNPPFGAEIIDKSEGLALQGEKLTSSTTLNYDLNYFIKIK